MKRLMGKIARARRKYDSHYFAREKYLRYFKKGEIDDYAILLEGNHGKRVDGNIYYLLKELTSNDDYKEYKIFLGVAKHKIEEIKDFLELNKISGVNFAIIHSKEYYKLLATAKFLISDVTFGPYFMKRAEQVYLNTWHGTPLKTLGKRMELDRHNIGNMQKNFCVSDYLLFPNEHTMKCMLDDHMLTNIAQGQALMGGYPRNTAFFDEERKNEIIKEQELEDKQVFAYMPTWRGTLHNVNNKVHSTYLMYNLLELDKRLQKNQIVYANFHTLVRDEIDFRIFNNIRPFPAEYETYEFLNVADCLISDYSSTFFDYAISRKKIILFAYDEESYLRDRGMYFGLSELPFPKVKTVDALVEEMNSPKNYDDEAFLKEFCSYDNQDATKDLCDRLILNRENSVRVVDIEGNGKENVLIYSASLIRNGITASLKNLLRNIDLEERNYFITFDSKKMTVAAREELASLPEDVGYLATAEMRNASFVQKILIKLYESSFLPAKCYIKLIGDMYKLEIRRMYGDVKFSNVIHFTGYEANKILVFSAFDSNRIIYVHSDMLREKEEKGKRHVHTKTLEYAYETYDKVALVTKELIEPTSKLAKTGDNFCVAENLVDYNKIIKLSKRAIEPDDSTEINVPLEKLEEILANQDVKKFITIGRFSVEKNHKRLLKSFEKLYKEDQDIALVMIGGYGLEYQPTLDYIQQMQSREKIIVVKSIGNPYPILAKCDYFILSSLYEGLPLVISEADVLKKPFVSTDIKGVRRFLELHGGTIVENSDEGVYLGMKMLLEDKVEVMNIDFDKHNKNALKQFYGMLT